MATRYAVKLNGVTLDKFVTRAEAAAYMRGFIRRAGSFGKVSIEPVEDTDT